ncbi:MAG: hypothetical protein KDH96_10385, partial [Candidatus Riesia sp.]|nr:hypothetical protein [Candidatus Riesia sp.]
EWESTPSYDLNFRYGDDFTLEELIDIFDKYFDRFVEDMDVDSIKNDIKQELGDNLYKKMNLKLFFKSLKSNLTLSQDKSVEYFEDYIETIPRRYRKIFDEDYDNYQKSEFEKLKKIKSQIKNKDSYKILDIEQDALYAELTKAVLWIKENGKKFLITLDGRDTGGKGSISRFILRNFFAAPLGRNVIYRDFGVPSEWEQNHWFERYKRVLPDNGQMVMFDRSWYNRAVNDPVMGYCTHEQYKKFMNDVVPFEEKLKRDGITHIKFWLSIEKETQLMRFKQRQASPIKHWKFSPNDMRAIDKWDDFTPYIQRMFKETGTKSYPWVVVNMDDKPLGWLNALRYILNKIPYENKDESILGIYPEIVYEIKN